MPPAASLQINGPTQLLDVAWYNTDEHGIWAHAIERKLASLGCSVPGTGPCGPSQQIGPQDLVQHVQLEETLLARKLSSKARPLAKVIIIMVVSGGTIPRKNPLPPFQ